MNIYFILHAVVSFLLTGLILTIQFVHYPLFSIIDAKNFNEYAQMHSKSITPLVAPLMILELLLALHFFYDHLTFYSSVLFVLTLIIWLSTFFIQVPIHSKLAKNHSYKDIKKLVKSNWIRTIAWLSKSAIFVYLFLK